MKMLRVNELFEVKYGVNLELIHLEECERSTPNSISFVSRTEKNNGVSAYVQRVEGLKPNPANTLSVAGGGSVLSTFFQKEEYYSGRDVYILLPKRKYSDIEMLFYAHMIRQNKYRYNYGRQANRTLKDILIPEEIPAAWAKTIKHMSFLKAEAVKPAHIELNIGDWKWYLYKDVFSIFGGYYNKKPEPDPKGEVPFIGATEYNNGVTSRHTQESIEETTKDGSDRNHEINKKIFKKGAITVSNNGSVGNAFYQPVDFTCSHDVNPLYAKNHVLNKYEALFICTVIGLEKYRWNYGRKWRPMRMPTSVIKLPTKNGLPDWQFMETYIKSLPYSSSL